MFLCMQVVNKTAFIHHHDEIATYSHKKTELVYISSKKDVI